MTRLSGFLGQAALSKTPKTKTRILAEVLKLQEEAETYREQMARESSELLLSLDVAAPQTDGPVEIQQKLAVPPRPTGYYTDQIGELDRQIRRNSKALDLRRQHSWSCFREAFAAAGRRRV